MDSEVLVVDMRSNVPEEARKSAAAMGQFDQSVGRARDALGRFVAAGQGTAQAVQSVTASTATLSRGLQQVEASAGRASKSKFDLGRAALEASRGIEDLQYGVHGVINNLPTLVMSLGGSAGLTAAISLAAVAANTLYRNWRPLMDSLGASDPIKTAAERMRELGDQINRTAAEEREYQRLKRQAEGVEGQAGGMTEAERAQQKAVREAIVGAPRAAMVEGLRLAAPGALESDPEVRRAKEDYEALKREVDKLYKAGADVAARQLAESGAAGIAGLVAPSLSDLEDRYVRAQEAAAARLLGAAETDPGSLARLRGVVESNPGAFPEGIAGRLAESTPEAQEEAERRKRLRKEEEEVEKENRANAERYFKRQEESRKRAARDAMEYEKENQANAERYFKDREAETERLNRAAREADKEAKDLAVKTGMEANPGMDSEVRQSLRDMVAGGGSVADARGTAIAFASERLQQGGTPKEWADEAAREFVDGILRSEQGRAVAESLDPAALEAERLGIMGQQLAISDMMERGGPKAPAVIAAEAFATQLQSAGAKSPNELLKEQIDLAQANNRLMADLKRIAERRGFLGP